MKYLYILLFLTLTTFTAMAQLPQPDRYATPQGELLVTHIGHASLLLQLNGQNIYVDPYGEVADFSGFPEAGLVLITHEHYDHLDKKELAKIVTPKTKIISTPLVATELKGVEVLKNGGKTTWNAIEIAAVPAYNIVQKRPDGAPFHPEGNGNGYILNIGGFRVYIAGDTELIPEMKTIVSPDIAFLPKNLPYTMSDEQFIEAAKQIQPKILYPYHYFEVDKAALSKALQGIEVK
ncbi:MAG: MBL fold metallo-hydrolase [Prevotellaceae bacterium]|jgi:L-ascorbate metabolism protein UlaG (beta-lactamase superfamily)|nr:MBL fold metallo-hydrolase [Prevotellaceae bacterium]